MKSKEKLVANLVSARKKIVARAQELPHTKRDEVFLGIWSFRDILAHLVGWDHANIDSVNDIREGKTPRIFEHYDPEWAVFNALLVKQYRRDDWDQMLADMARSHNELIAFLQEIPQTDFHKDFGSRRPDGSPITIASDLQAEIDDEHEHLEAIQEWLNRSQND